MRCDLRVVAPERDELDQITLATGQAAKRRVDARLPPEGMRVPRRASAAMPVRSRAAGGCCCRAARSARRGCGSRSACLRRTALARRAWCAARSSGRLLRGRSVDDVDLVEYAHEAPGVRGRGRDALELVEPVMLLGRSAGNELRREELSERRDSPVPSPARRACSSPPLLRAARRCDRASAGLAHSRRAGSGGSRVRDGAPRRRRRSMRPARCREAESDRRRSHRPPSRDRAPRRRTRDRRRSNPRGRSRARRSGPAYVRCESSRSR